jgi:hypothetical protein
MLLTGGFLCVCWVTEMYVCEKNLAWLHAKTMLQRLLFAAISKTNKDVAVRAGFTGFDGKFE